MQNVPDEKVAAEIVADIKEQKLLPLKRLLELEEKLASWGMAEEDWVLLADLSSNEESK